MKSVATLIVLLSTAALLPAQAQTVSAAPKATATNNESPQSRHKPAGKVVAGAQAVLAKWHRKQSRKKSVPYAHAVRNNELFRDQPKDNETD